MAHDGSHDGIDFITLQSYQITMWVLCVVATLFLASRFAVRFSTKGKLMINDYFLIPALPMLLAGCGLLQSILSLFFTHEGADARTAHNAFVHQAGASQRLAAAIEMLWGSIYSVKFCFLAQFKFHKPPYAYVSPHLTRYYWTSIGICGAAYLFTLVQPIVLCPNAGSCRYSRFDSSVAWEVAATTLDIVVDLLVISFPLLLVYRANFTRAHTFINATFKSLSVFAIAIAATRLNFQYSDDGHEIDYISMTFWLLIEAAVALIVASISSYRVALVDYLAERRHKQEPVAAPINPRQRTNTYVSLQEDPARMMGSSMKQQADVELESLSASPSTRPMRDASSPSVT